MSKIWFTSDQHFGHKKILNYSDRPYNTVEEMEKGIIDNFNSVVGNDDIVYHLGDISFHKPTVTESIFNTLKGRHHLILGNHDEQRFKDYEKLNIFESISHIKYIHVHDIFITLCHFPMLSWNKQYYGSYMLHGHTHGTLKFDGISRRLDVGVDANDYYPVSFEQVYKKLNPISSPIMRKTEIYKNDI